MNLALSDEQVLLREAARGALSRFKTLEEAREALDSGGSPSDLWPTAKEAGWPGLLIDEARGGAGLDAFDAMLVLGECGRSLAAVPLLGHLPASAILNDGAGEPGEASLLEELASGERRAAYLAARPPDDLSERWSVDPAGGMERPGLPTVVRGGNGEGRVSGRLAFVPDAPGADLLVGVAQPASPESADAAVVGFTVESSAAGVSVEAVRRYDATRALGHVTLEDAPATILDVPEGSLAEAWHLAQALIAAESLGAVESALDMSVAYAKERFTFGRAIGSYQAVKHSLTDVLRQLENGRSLLYYAGWSRHGAPAEFALAANAARSVAGRALDHAARTMISVHGGIGATWEHDAPLYFRRAQLSRRLLGGTALATDRVAGELIAQG
jgi:alkylation response protein AidB-like acyl-CoA dehydrogenase